MKQVWEWIKNQKEMQQKEKSAEDKIKQLQHQIELMSKNENRQQCQVTGMNLFSNLEAIQGEAGTELAAKAQAAMVATNTMKR